jgi:hypothetical protein
MAATPWKKRKPRVDEDEDEVKVIELTEADDYVPPDVSDYEEDGLVVNISTEEALSHTRDVGENPDYEITHDNIRSDKRARRPAKVDTFLQDKLNELEALRGQREQRKLRKLGEKCVSKTPDLF